MNVTKFMLVGLLSCGLLRATDSSSYQDCFVCCVQGNCLEEASQYIDREPDYSLSCLVNCSDWCGETPLGCAARCGHLEMVELLLSHGASINLVSSEKQRGPKRTPLVWAIFNGHMNVVKRLLSAGALSELNLLTYFVIKHIAEKATIEKRDLDKVRFLMLHGPDLCYKDDQGKTTMDFILTVPELFQVFKDCAGETSVQTEEE